MPSPALVEPPASELFEGLADGSSPTPLPDVGGSTSPLAPA